MSLSGWNSPALVAVGGAAAFASFPAFENAVSNGALSLSAVKVLNCALYALCMYAVQQPGRIDGQQVEEMRKRAAEGGSNEPNIDDYTGRGRSMLFPSGWAFAIWGPILLGELIFCVSSTALVKESSTVAPLFKNASAGFMMAQIFQTLWTMAFRPKYKGNLAFISSSLLSGIAYSLSRAHHHFASAANMSRFEYLLFFLPMSLHFGWTTAASLVNWNGSIALPEEVSPLLVAACGQASSVAAAILGVSVTLSRRAPVFGGVIAWALTACMTGMTDRLKSLDMVNEKEKETVQKQAGFLGARVQKWLCGSGAVASAAASLYVILSTKSE